MNPISFSGKHLMYIFMMVIAGGAVIISLKWPFKTALFPLIIGIPVFFLSFAELLMSLFERKGVGAKQSTLDFKFSEDIDQTIAIRRALLISTWIIGFFILILFLGFPIGTPLFVLLYLKLQGKEKWGISIIMAASVLVFFYGLFIRLLHVSFREGWVIKGMRMLGIG